MTPPASRTLSTPPRNNVSSCSTERSSGHAAICSTKSTSPPIAKTSDIAFAAPIAPEAYASSTIGGKKSSVSTIATSGATRYTAASSLGFRPTSRSAGLGCCCRGRRTCASGPGPNLAPQPAQVASVVRRTSSRVNTLVSLGRSDSGQGHGAADRRVPDADREKDEQRGQCEVLRRAPAADDHEQQE